MTMEEPDYIEEKFRESLAGYTAEPPPAVWDAIRRELHPESGRPEIGRNTGIWSKLTPRLINTFSAVAATVIILVLTLLYFLNHDLHRVHGHAYAGETRLCSGTAILFKVNDKVAPYDSVTPYQTVAVDSKGYYHFSDVDDGRYLLRISPAENSDQSIAYKITWFNQQGPSDTSHLINLENEDFYGDVFLLEKGDTTRNK